MKVGNFLINKKFLAIYIVLVTTLNVLPITCVIAQAVMEGYYLRTRNYPSFGNLWTLNGLGDGEAQGVTHDDNNWFFTWTYNSTGYLFRVPVEVAINNDLLQNPNVRIINMNQFPVLKGYWHWGDLDHYKFDGQGYLIIPITGQGDPIIAIFRSRDMSLVAFGKLGKQKSTGWCAVHPKTGVLYSSEDFDYKPEGSNCDDQSHHFLYPRKLLLYNIPWNILPQSGYLGQITLTDGGSQELLKGDGGQMELYNMQGGEFTPSGELLYISSGSGCCEGKGPGQQYEIDGIRAFETQTWREIARSNNRQCNCSAPRYFDFAYLGCDGAASWSPQGLTIWDLDNGRAPNISGQLHVMLFKFRAFGENRQVMTHFTNRVHIDQVNGIDATLPNNLGDDSLPGTSLKPFKTFSHAINNYPIWNGAQAVLRSGYHNLPNGGITLNKRMLITSLGGTAIIR